MTILAGRWRSEAGGALVELAVAVPVLIVIFAATIDFARVFHTSMALTNAARAGAQYGAHNPAQSTDIAGMQNRAQAATSTTGITAVATRACQCATDAGVFSPTSPSANNCTDPETTSCPGQHVVMTVTVTVTKTFTTVMTGFPAIPSSVSLSRTATMRVHQ